MLCVVSMPHSTGSRSSGRQRSEAERRRRVLQVAKEVSATLGNDFFHTLAKHLADGLDADYVYVAELAGPLASRVKTLAFYNSGGTPENFDQDLSGSAAKQALTDGVFACSRDATRLFPLDRLLADMTAEACAAARLSDSFGQPIGLLGLVFQERLSDVKLVSSVLEAFVPRAAAELERKRADDALRESEERHRAFISSNPDAMWRIEFEQPISTHLDEEEQIDQIYKFGYLAECNDAMCRLTGARRVEEILGARINDIAPRSDARVLEELREAIRSGFRTMTVETSPLDDGGRRQYRLRSQFGIVEEGALRRIWFTTRDLTDLRRAEMSLAAAERRFRDVLENIQLPAVMLRTEGTVTFCNDCLLSLVHRSKEELDGRNWVEEMIPADEREKWRNALLPEAPLQQASSLHFEGRVLSGNALPRLIAWSTAVLRDEEDRFCGLAAIGSDITDQRLLEAEIRQAQKLETIGRVAGGIAHDFNNLLTIVQGYSSRLLKNVAAADPQYADLAAIEQAVSKCAELTQQLLTIGRRKRLEPKVINLNDLVAGEEAILRNLIGDTIKLILALNSGPALIQADQSEIRRILPNLVTNARDAMPHGGTLTVKISNVRIGAGGRHYPANIKPGHYVGLSVADTGIGLTEETKAHVFEPFFTTKAPGKGTGLGLSTVFGIVTQSGGYVVVRSKPGEGSTFEVLLPAVELEPKQGS